MLRGILSHKIFEHVQNFRDYFAPLGDTCEDITNHWRLFRDCFATHSRCLSPAVAKQSQSSEIGALTLECQSKQIQKTNFVIHFFIFCKVKLGILCELQADDLGLDAKNSVFGVFETAGLKPVSSATETS